MAALVTGTFWLHVCTCLLFMSMVNVPLVLSAEAVMVFFFLQVETMHDFEAANCDELELKRGDVVLVVPTASVEDQVRTTGDQGGLLLVGWSIVWLLCSCLNDSHWSDNPWCYLIVGATVCLCLSVTVAFSVDRLFGFLKLGQHLLTLIINAYAAANSGSYIKRNETPILK